MNDEMVVLYDPSVLNAEFTTGADDREEYRQLIITDPNNGKEVIKEAVQEVIARLPFNGEYRNSDLMAAVQAIEGVGGGYCRRTGMFRWRDLYRCSRLSPPLFGLLRA